MENAVVYARYSSHAQSEQSIEGQLAAAYKYAKDHSYNIIKEYCDRAKTGTNDNREQFQRMLKDTAKKNFTVIIVWKVDRFGRNREEITFNKYKCKKNGVRIEYVAENISAGPEGVILESVLEGMAEYYSLQLSQNVKRGYLESAKKHHVIGSPPLGYDRAPDMTYAVNEDEAKIVRLIFDKYNNGESQADITRYLNDNGFTTKRGCKFSKTAVQRILCDERYIGVYTFKSIREENIITPIVERSVFNAARYTKKVYSYDEYKLSRILYCKCGKKVYGSSGYNKNHVKYNYYVCPTCKRIRVRADKLEDLVYKKVDEILSSQNIIEDLADKVYEYYLSQVGDKTEEELIAKNIEDIEKKMRNLVKSIENGINPDIIVPRIKELEKEKDNLSLKLSKIAIERPFQVNKGSVIEFLTQVERDVFIRKIVLMNGKAILALNCVDTETSIDCSTLIQQIGSMNHGSNIMVYKTLALVKMFL